MEMNRWLMQHTAKQNIGSRGVPVELESVIDKFEEG
jgi:hypothetical protein